MMGVTRKIAPVEKITGGYEARDHVRSADYFDCSGRGRYAMI